MHLRLTSLAIFVQFLGIATAAVYRELRDTSNEARNESVCLTQVCNDTASTIIKDMDLTVNPCVDFYAYICGGFLKRDLPSGTLVTTGSSRAGVQFKSLLKSFFEADFADDDTRPFKLQKILYKACMNEESIERKGVLPLKMLTQMLGGWPVLEGASWNESKFHWMATTAAWARAGLSQDTFFNFGIQADIRNNSRRVLSIKPPSWIIKSQDLNQGFNGTAATRAYYTLMVDVAVSLGADKKKAEDELKEALLFQIKLSNAKAAAKRGILRLTLKALIERYPTVDWRDIFARMYSPTQTIVDGDKVVVYNSTFVTSAIDLVSRTPKRILANFAMFQIIPPRLRTMNKESNEKVDAYTLARDNYVKRDQRWIYCTTAVIKGMPVGVTYIYAKKLLKPETKVQFEAMIQNIKQEFRANIDKVPFLDNATRASAQDKASAIKIVVGHPDKLLDHDKLENFYKNLDLFDDYFFDSIRLNKFYYDIEVGEFRKPMNYINSTEEYRYFLTATGYADQILNSISFSPTALQRIFFDPERPRYMDFAAAGTLIGHEITHLFDTNGMYYDANGAPNGWFTPASEQSIEGHISCLLYQYGNYTENTINRNVNGELTLEENIADNAAVKRAYHAYVNTMRGKAPEKRLPGLDFTPNQMFWIAYGNMWCQKWMASYLESKWEKEKHATGRFRVIGPLSNSEEFAKDFNCQLGSAMNPIKKCSMW